MESVGTAVSLVARWPNKGNVQGTGFFCKDASVGSSPTFSTGKKRRPPALRSRLTSGGLRLDLTLHPW